MATARKTATGGSPLRRWEKLWFATFAALFFGKSASIFNWYIDDAFISQVYARTLISCGKFAFACLDEPHYGISNPLWVFILTIPHGLGLNAYLFEKFFTLTSAAGVLALLAAWARAAPLGEKMCGIPHITFALLCVSWNYSIWSIGGLETLFLSLVIAAGVFLLAAGPARPRTLFWAGILHGVVVWLRPEGAVFGAMGIVCVALMAGSERQPALSAVGRYLGGFVPIAVLFPITMWCLTNAVLPSTYYLKAGHIDLNYAKKGLNYFLRVFEPGYWVLPSLAAAGWILALAGYLKRQSHARSFASRVAMLSALIGSGYAVGFIIPVGGDWMIGGRFFIHVYPLLAILAAVALNQIIDGCRHFARRPILVAATVLPVCIFLLGTELRRLYTRNNSDTGYFIGRVLWTPPSARPAYPAASFEIARDLNDGCSDDDYLAMTEGGFFPYYVHCNAFDLHGWSQRDLAMALYETRVWTSPRFIDGVLSRKPRYVLLSGYGDDPVSMNPRLAIERGIRDHEVFKHDYRFVRRYAPINEIYRYARHRVWGAPLAYFLFERDVASD